MATDIRWRLTLLEANASMENYFKNHNMKNYRIIEWDNAQVLLRKSFNNKDDDGAPYLLNMEIDLQSVALTQILSFEKVEDRDSAFDKLTDDQAKDFYNYNKAIIED